MKNEEEKNQLLLKLFYNCYFRISEPSILEDYYCEKSFGKYKFNQKLWPQMSNWVTLKKAVFEHINNVNNKVHWLDIQAK